MKQVKMMNQNSQQRMRRSLNKKYILWIIAIVFIIAVSIYFATMKRNNNVNKANENIIPTQKYEMGKYMDLDNINSQQKKIAEIIFNVITIDKEYEMFFDSLNNVTIEFDKNESVDTAAMQKKIQASLTKNKLAQKITVLNK